MEEGIQPRTVNLILKNKDEEVALRDSKTCKVIVIKGVLIQQKIHF